ncbi:MAG: hypothetical protein F6K31_27115 [Symploca sp. SIO2G7]|nr:hypothetical protein [Symploca sp. SIO2G7]
MAAVQLFFLVLGIAYLVASNIDAPGRGYGPRRCAYRPFRVTRRWGRW